MSGIADAMLLKCPLLKLVVFISIEVKPIFSMKIIEKVLGVWIPA
jgi:hypothetical protein